MRCALVVLVAACAGSSSPPEPLHGDLSRAPARDVAVTYRTWGLMPAACSKTYEIAVTPEVVTCGWRTECSARGTPPPTVPQPHGHHTTHQLDPLAQRASTDAFRAFPQLDSNPHIIDGGEELLLVRVDTHEQTVELANLDKPAFAAVRDALRAATGCTP